MPSIQLEGHADVLRTIKPPLTDKLYLILNSNIHEWTISYKVMAAWKKRHEGAMLASRTESVDLYGSSRQSQGVQEIRDDRHTLFPLT